MALFALVWAVMLAGACARADAAPQRRFQRPRCTDDNLCGAVSGPARAAPAAACVGGALRYGGGLVMTHASVQLVFWGPSWATSPGDVVSGVDRFLKGYAAPNNQHTITANEYTGYNGRVGSVSYHGYRVDTSTPPWPKGPWPGAPSSTAYDAQLNAAVEAKVCAQTLADRSGKALVVVVVDREWPGVPYCAWHTSTTCSSGVHVQYAFVWGNPLGGPSYDGVTCSWQQPFNVGHSQALAMATNNIVHELHEARTDPDPNTGWVDDCGLENADKCGYMFNVPVVFPGGERWWIQSEWSNRAFAAGTGFANGHGQKGCIYTVNAPSVPSGFVACGTMGQLCLFNGRSNVVFGAKGFGYVTANSVPSPFLCNSGTVGGDPAYNKTKTCYVTSSALSLTALPSGFAVCAQTNGRCSFSRPTNVVFGAAGKYRVVPNVPSPFSCTVANVGMDPAPGMAKSCHVLQQTLMAG